MWSWAIKECDINNFIQSGALVRALAKLLQQQPKPLICNCFIIRVTNNTFISVLDVIFHPPQLFIPDRSRCFQQPQILPPWCQWKEAAAAAESIALLWQHIPLPRGPRCLGDIRRADAGRSNCLKAAGPQKAGQPWPVSTMNEQREMN